MSSRPTRQKQTVPGCNHTSATTAKGGSGGICSLRRCPFLDEHWQAQNMRDNAWLNARESSRCWFTTRAATRIRTDMHPLYTEVSPPARPLPMALPTHKHAYFLYCTRPPSATTTCARPIGNQTWSYNRATVRGRGRFRVITRTQTAAASHEPSSVRHIPL